MNKQRGYLLTCMWAIAMVALALPAMNAAADGRRHKDKDDRPSPERSGPFMQLMPDEGVIKFQQVHWDLELADLGPSNWGQVAIDPDALARKLRRAFPPEPIVPPDPIHPLGKDRGERGGKPSQVPPEPVHSLGKWKHGKDDDDHGRHGPKKADVPSEAYVNVFLFAPGSNRPIWSIENIPVYLGDCGEDEVRQGQSQPVCRYMNLAPHRDMVFERIRAVEATVLVSEQPMPLTGLLLPAVQKFESERFMVARVLENAEGMLPDPLLNTFPPRQFDPRLPIGYPPDPVVPELIPIPDLDLIAPVCVFQTAAPNIECAKNQCVPMAQANAIQYLEDRYNGGLLAWTLPQPPIPGIGQVTSAGDVVFWQPVPSNSLVAHVDTFTRRQGVFDFETGSGSTICQLFRGLFGYLESAEPYTAAVFRHQGTNAPIIGDGGFTCSTPTIDLGGRISVREGEDPTWEWIFDQLSQGRAVTICFGRYDAGGNRTSGHCVRVWGACQFGGSKYLYTLDDGNQGANNVGTRTQVWNVADTGGPGNNPGTPDGRMNLDGMSWEIEFANSIQVKPTLLIP